MPVLLIGLLLPFCPAHASPTRQQKKLCLVGMDSPNQPLYAHFERILAAKYGHHPDFVYTFGVDILAIEKCVQHGYQTILVVSHSTPMDQYEQTAALTYVTALTGDLRTTTLRQWHEEVDPQMAFLKETTAYPRSTGQNNLHDPLADKITEAQKLIPSAEKLARTEKEGLPIYVRIEIMPRFFQRRLLPLLRQQHSVKRIFFVTCMQDEVKAYYERPFDEIEAQGVKIDFEKSLALFSFFEGESVAGFSEDSMLKRIDEILSGSR